METQLPHITAAFAANKGVIPANSPRSTIYRMVEKILLTEIEIAIHANKREVKLTPGGIRMRARNKLPQQESRELHPHTYPPVEFYALLHTVCKSLSADRGFNARLEPSIHPKTGAKVHTLLITW